MLQLLKPLWKLAIACPREVGDTVAEVTHQQGPGLTVAIATSLAGSNPARIDSLVCRPHVPLQIGSNRQLFATHLWIQFTALF